MSSEKYHVASAFSVPGDDIVPDLLRASRRVMKALLLRPCFGFADARRRIWGRCLASRAYLGAHSPSPTERSVQAAQSGLISRVQPESRRANEVERAPPCHSVE
jgi:hypothetical protein